MELVVEPVCARCRRPSAPGELLVAVVVHAAPPAPAVQHSVWLCEQCSQTLGNPWAPAQHPDE